jgi:NAD(P)-dependent dehydrogenase (short-subunit alcohol dehydrogenase family)
MRKIVITGACSGIGEATYKKFISDGNTHVIILDLNAEKGNEISEENEHVSFYQLDVSNYEKVVAVAKQIKEDFGTIDGLIHNAGISIRHKFVDITIDEWNKVIDTNLNSSFYLVSSFHAMLNDQSTILFTASTNGIMGYPYYVDYNVSKAGVISMVKSLALEFAPNIRVNCVCPGYVMTPMQRAEYTDEMLLEVNSKLPLKRHAKPEEIANAFYYLSSPEASFITGTNLVVDGGEIAGGLASR